MLMEFTVGVLGRKAMDVVSVVFEGNGRQPVEKNLVLDDRGHG